MGMTDGRADAIVHMARELYEHLMVWGRGMTHTEVAVAAGYKRSPWTRDALLWLVQHDMVEVTGTVKRRGFVADVYALTQYGRDWLESAGQDAQSN